MKLVRFPNGKYGVRKGWLFFHYRDLVQPQYWWGMSDEYFYDCQGTEERARQVLAMSRRGIGEVVVPIKPPEQSSSKSSSGAIPTTVSLIAELLDRVAALENQMKGKPKTPRSINNAGDNNANVGGSNADH